MPDLRPRVEQVSAPSEGPGGTEPSKRHGPLLLAVILIAGAALRLWSIRHGLPYVYGEDERLHFVAPAIRFFSDGYDPGNFYNPPAFSYLIHGVLRARYSPSSISALWASSPEHVYLIARVVTVALGTATAAVTYLIGRRIGGRRVGLMAALLMSLAFLPVSQSRWAVNDVPAVLPMAAALLASVRILQEGRLRDYVLAGLFAGVATSTKYTAAIAFLPVVIAAAFRAVTGDRGEAFRRLVVAGATSVLAFVAVNPFAVWSAGTFSHDIVAQTTGTKQKLGQTASNGIVYYLWVLTWGLGWVPLAAALGGVVALARRNIRAAALLVAPALLFLVFMGTRARYFSRWSLPIFPMVCVLAAYGAIRLADIARSRGIRTRRAVAIAIGVALVAQSVVYGVHAAAANAREDTRAILRAWMTANIDPRTPIVLEPVVSPEWLRRPVSEGGDPAWNVVGVEREAAGYIGRLRPSLIDQTYRRLGVCYVVVASTQAGRAEVRPDLAPDAIAYYRALEDRAEVAFRVAPWPPGRDQRFSFDFTTNLYPFAYARPGPALTVYLLDEPSCR